MVAGTGTGTGLVSEAQWTPRLVLLSTLNRSGLLWDSVQLVVNPSSYHC